MQCMYIARQEARAVQNGFKDREAADVMAAGEEQNERAQQLTEQEKDMWEDLARQDTNERAEDHVSNDYFHH